MVLKFTTSNGQIVEEQLALPVQFAQVIMESELIPVRYLQSSYKPIVMMPVYDLQQNVIKVNMGVSSFGFLVTLIISIYASRFARRRINDGEETFEIEMMEDV